MEVRNKFIWGIQHHLYFKKSNVGIYPYIALIIDANNEIVKRIGYESAPTVKELKHTLAKYEKDKIK